MKGNQWCFGMKAHIGVDAGTGYVHSVTATAASVHDLDQFTRLVRADDEVVYADTGPQGASKRPDVADDPRLSQVEFRIAARKSKLAAMAGPDRAAESRKASVRTTLAKLRRYGLIIVDDVGHLPLEAEAANLFFQLVSSRYEHASLVLTSNLPFNWLGKRLRRPGRRRRRRDRPHRPPCRRPDPQRRQLPTTRTRHRLPAQRPHHHPRRPNIDSRNRSLFDRRE